jgi:hypothetical protein
LFVLRDVRVPGAAQAVREAISRHAPELESIAACSLTHRTVDNLTPCWY